MTFSLAIFTVVLVVSFIVSIGQVVNDPVVCAVGVRYADGKIRLDDFVSGTGSTITTVNDTLSSMTRDESSGIFYFASVETHHLWKYDPCTGR